MSEFKQLNREEYEALDEKDREIFQQSYLNHHLPMFEKYTEGTILMKSLKVKKKQMLTLKNKKVKVLKLHT